MQPPATNQGQDTGQLLARLSDVSVQLGGEPILQHIQLHIHFGEQWAIIGDSGSGKTTLAHVLAGRVFFTGQLEYFFKDDASSNVVLVDQQHHFKNRSNTSQFYYQQRFNASEADDSITVTEALAPYGDGSRWIQLLHLEPVMHEPLLQLSNGENKRLQLARALLAEPRLLVLDNPFTGLDAEGRQILQQILSNISRMGIHLVLMSSATELPACITHVAVLHRGRLQWAGSRVAYSKQHAHGRTSSAIDSKLLQQLRPAEQHPFEVAIGMQEVTVRYAERVILDQVSWLVKRGECWNVSGPNGAGKSTLLSLVTADNPQAYANKIILFDRQRGTGETIWDIKKNIGFVSPELHLYFEQSASCFEVIASGLFDTIGLFRKLTTDQEERVLRWMELMHLGGFRHKRIFQLSTSQQRMALLARALVKNPAMLVLDEPAQGLDEEQGAAFKLLVNEICAHFGTTLIYVSHYLADLPACIQHYLRLENGRVLKGWTPQQV